MNLLKNMFCLNSSISPANSTNPDDYFKNWKPQNHEWQSNNTESFKNLKYDNNTFKEIFNREPNKNENVVGLTKAGIVVNCVFGLSPPPTNMNKNECSLIMDAMTIIGEKDKSIGFALAMTAGMIRNANPQCDQYWKELNKH
jgi:hypothetical protein